VHAAYKSLKLVLELGMRLVGDAPPLTFVLVKGPTTPRGCPGKPNGDECILIQTEQQNKLIEGRVNKADKKEN
jgi:hypothetical protein